MQSDRAIGKAFNIAHDQPITQAQYLSLVAKELDAPEPRTRVPYKALYAAAGAAERLSTASGYRIKPFVTRHGVKLYGADNRISIDRAARELSYAPEISVSDAVVSACRWYQDSEREMPSPAAEPVTVAAR